MQVIPAKQMIADAVAEVDMIRTASGFQEAHFELLCLPVLRAYANHVQHMPLSPTVYRDAKGAWDFGLLASMVAFRFAGTQLFFHDLGSEERRSLEPQCRFAAFAATLATGVALLAQNAQIYVKNADELDEYHPLVTPEPLSEWLEDNPRAQFLWRNGQKVLTPPECAAIASRFMPTGLLARFDLRISLMLFNSVSPQTNPAGIETTLSKVVRLSIAKVFERYLETEARKFQERESLRSSASEATKLADELVATVKPREIINPLDPATVIVKNAEMREPAAATDGSAPNVDVLLANAGAVLREWFSALKRHERYPDLKNNLTSTDRGIEIPISMLGFFGVNGPTIKKMMVDAGMVVDRTADGRGLILQPSLKPLFGDPEA